MHHIGLIAGAALVTGAAGNTVFFVVGLVFSIPLLQRLYRRFGTWRAPVIAVTVFAVLFSVSAFVIGPALTRGPTPASGPVSTVSSSGPAAEHSGHHGPQGEGSVRP